MCKYKREYTPEFLKDVKQLKSSFGLQKRLKSKIEKILENPFHYKSLRNVLKGRRRTHIESYVLTFEVNEVDRKVIFKEFQHHDKVYKQKK